MLLFIRMETSLSLTFLIHIASEFRSNPTTMDFRLIKELKFYAPLVFPLSFLPATVPHTNDIELRKFSFQQQQLHTVKVTAILVSFTVLSSHIFSLPNCQRRNRVYEKKFGTIFLLAQGHIDYESVMATLHILRMLTRALH